MLPALAVTALAACGASTVITKVDIAHYYMPSDIGRFHGGDNALRVVGYGSPFGDPPARVAAAVVAAMQSHNGGPRVTFSAAPAPPPNPRWRVVMALNPTELRDTIELCKLAETPATAPLTARSQGGRLRIMAAFCQGDGAETQATARGKDIFGLDSPNFDLLLARLTRALFPSFNPHDDRGRPCLIFPCRL
jgi:hypothetical protein